MPHYVVSSEAPISVRPVNRPDLPDWEAGQLPVFPDRPSLPRPPEGWEPPGLPTLPPREEWPPLPPLPERPPWHGHTPEHPWVPVEPDPDGPETLPPVWPPILPEFPGLPDLSGKTLVLARLYVSRHVNYLRWVVIDHDEARSKLQRLKEWIKGRLPAGGIGGRPPDVRPPVPGNPGQLPGDFRQPR